MFSPLNINTSGLLHVALWIVQCQAYLFYVCFSFLKFCKTRAVISPVMES